MTKIIFKYLNIYKQNHIKEGIIKQGLWGLKAINYGIISKEQLEATRRVVMRLTKKSCKLWIRVICLTPTTKKSIGARMGKGVGSFCKNICNVKRGDILLEIFTNLMMSDQSIKKILLEASKKLSVSTKLYKKTI